MEWKRRCSGFLMHAIKAVRSCCRRLLATLASDHYERQSRKEQGKECRQSEREDGREDKQNVRRTAAAAATAAAVVVDQRTAYARQREVRRSRTVITISVSFTSKEPRP